MMQQQPRFQLPDPQQYFRDPTFNAQSSRMSDQEMQARMNNMRIDFAPPPPPPQVQNFNELNNAKLFQVQSLHNDLNTIKTTFQAKIAEIEKRLQIIEQPSLAGPNPANNQPFQPPAQMTNFQPLQTQVQGFQPQQGFQQQPMQQQQMQQQPMQQQPMQQQPMQQQPMQGGFQPFRAAAPPNFR